MMKVSAIAASVRTLAGVSGLGLGYALSTSMLANLEVEVSAETWNSLLATESFATIGALFVTMLTVGIGILFAYVADSILSYFLRRNVRSAEASTPSDTSLKI
jgi:hypothetical protein